MRGLDGAMAEGVVGAARGRPGRGRRGRVPDRVRGRSGEVALGTDGGIRGVGGGVVRSGGVMPGLGRMRRSHPMAAGTGLGGDPSGEVLSVTDLAGNQAPAVGPGGQLGPGAMDGRSAPGRKGLVVAEHRGTGRNIAASRSNRQLVTLGARVQPRDGATRMAADPAGRVVVLAEVHGRCAGTAAPTTSAPKEGQRKREGQSEQANQSCQALPGEEVDGKFSITLPWGHAEILEFGTGWIHQSIIESFGLSSARRTIVDFKLISILNVAT